MFNETGSDGVPTCGDEKPSVSFFNVKTSVETVVNEALSPSNILVFNRNLWLISLRKIGLFLNFAKRTSKFF
jgi:hypothetical protein